MTSISRVSASEKTILDDLIGVARRRKGVIIITTVATLLAVYLSLFFVPETYEATALLEVLLGRQNTEPPATVRKGSVYPSGVQREEVNSNIRMLKARESVEDVVDTLGLAAFRFEPPPPQTLLQHVRYSIRRMKALTKDTLTNGLVAIGLKKKLTEREKVIALLTRSLDATREGESNVIRVSLGLPSREVAIEALATILKSFIDRNPYLKAATGVLPVLEEQVSSDAKELQTLQQERQQIMQEGGLSSVDRQRAELLQRLHKVLYEVDEKKSQLVAAGARLAELTTNPVRQSVRDEIDQSNLQIAGLRAGIRQDEMNAQTIDKTLSELNAAADRLQLVNLHIDGVEKRFMLDAAHRDAAKVDQALDQHKVLNVAVISDVGASPEPVSPNKLRFIAIGAVGGLVLGISLAMLLVWGDDRIRRKEELSRLSGLPFFGEFELKPIPDPRAGIERAWEAAVESRTGSPTRTPAE